MGEKEKDSFWQFESKECEFKDIITMLWFIIEDYYSLQENDLYTKADNYDRLGVFLNNIYTLLFKRQKEMEEFINEVVEERKRMKEIKEDIKTEVSI